MTTLTQTQTSNKPRKGWRNGCTRQGSNRQNAKTFKAIVKQENERKAQVKAEITRLEAEMPANAVAVKVLYTFYKATDTREMSFDEFAQETISKSYASFAGWVLEGIIGRYCNQIVDDILNNDELFDVMNEEPAPFDVTFEMKCELFDMEQQPYKPYVARETLEEVM